MKHFKVIISPYAHNDIEQAMDYYNEQTRGLGKRFLKEVKNTANSINKNPFFQIRYNDVRCLLVKKFPFMIHYSVNEKNKLIFIHAVIHTSLNPEENWID